MDANRNQAKIINKALLRRPWDSQNEDAAEAIHAVVNKRLTGIAKRRLNGHLDSVTQQPKTKV